MLRSEVYDFPGVPFHLYAILFKMASSQERNLLPVDLFRVLEITIVSDLLFSFVNDSDLRSVHSLTVVSRRSVVLLQHRTWTVLDEQGQPAFQITYL